jgi:hypothetical protein
MTNAILDSARSADRTITYLNAEVDNLQTRASRPRDAVHAYDWLYERAEEAATAGLSLEDALQAVRDGYSSIDADRAIAEDP